MDLQIRKSQDYQNEKSNIVQAMHYRRGVSTIHDMVAQKLLRAQSLLEPQENGGTHEPNFESLEDTYKDAINYLSFAVAYLRGKMEGQDPTRDIFNRNKPTSNFQENKAIDTSKYSGEVGVAFDSGVMYHNKVTDVGDRIDEDMYSISHWGHFGKVPR